MKEKAVETANIGLINDVDRGQWEEKCFNAMEEEILREKLFVSRGRGSSRVDTKPSKEELQEQSQWVVDEMGVARSFAAVKDKSWLWQMYCLLSGERRRITTYKQYETFMLGAVKRLEKGVLEEEQAARVARIVDVYTQMRGATSHGSDSVSIAEVIDVESEDSILLGVGVSKDACEKEREGTSHAQDQAAQVGSNSVVSFSAAPLLPSTCKDKDEAHPPIRTVRGLTHPDQEAEGENSPSSEADHDPELELLLAQARKTRKQLK